MSRWIYSYKTSDGTWCESNIDAPEREAVFTALKKRGIRPIKVELAPGFVNWLSSLGKRWAAIVALTLICAALVVLLTRSEDAPLARAANAVPRQVIAGKPAKVDPQTILQAFPHSAERFLVRYAEPGVPVIADGRESLKDLSDSLKHEIAPSEDDEDWLRTLKQIVTGMKEEAASLLQSGKRVEDIELWIDERQKMETTYKQQILEGSGDEREKRRRLKAMGF